MFEILYVTTFLTLLTALYVIIFGVFRRNIISRRAKPIMYWRDSGGEVVKHTNPTRNLYSNATYDLTIVIPAYNEEKRIPFMVNDALDYFQELQETEKISVEIIVVDDGSRDGTVKTCYDYMKPYNGELDFKILKLCENSGKGLAVKTGIMAAQGKEILYADADGSTPMSEHMRLHSSILSNEFAIACGSRAQVESYVKLNMGDRIVVKCLLRKSLSFCFSIFTRFALGHNIKDTQCGFKLLTRGAAQKVIEKCHINGWAFDLDLLYQCRKNGVYIKEVPVSWVEKKGSKLRIGRDSFLMAFDVLRIVALDLCKLDLF